MSFKKKATSNTGATGTTGTTAASTGTGLDKESYKQIERLFLVHTEDTKKILRDGLSPITKSVSDHECRIKALEEAVGITSNPATPTQSTTPATAAVPTTTQQTTVATSTTTQSQSATTTPPTPPEQTTQPIITEHTARGPVMDGIGKVYEVAIPDPDLKETEWPRVPYSNYWLASEKGVDLVEKYAFYKDGCIHHMLMCDELEANFEGVGTLRDGPIEVYYYYNTEKKKYVVMADFWAAYQASNGKYKKTYAYSQNGKICIGKS